MGQFTPAADGCNLVRVLVTVLAHLVVVGTFDGDKFSCFQVVKRVPLKEGRCIGTGSGRILLETNHPDSRVP